MDDDIDVLVIGAGAGGLTAAIAAADAGADVAIIEKQDRPGGNSSLSTGSMIGAGTRFQKAAGIEDSPDRLMADITRIAAENDCPATLRRLAFTSAQTTEWLVDVAGVELVLITDYKHVGHSVPRLHAVQSRRGQDLVDGLLAAVERRDIPLAVGNSATGLIVEAGAVIGAMVDSGDGPAPLRARKTILAMNGFAANKALVARFCPEVAQIEYFGAKGSTGEAVLWGEPLGAALGNMGAYQGYAAVAYPQGSLVSWTTIEKGAVMVNAAGRRFGDESLGYSGFTPLVKDQEGYCFVIFDRRILDIAAKEAEFQEMVEHGAVRQAATPRALAEDIGIDPDVFAQTLSTYAAAARGETVDPFGRSDFGMAPLAGTLYAVRATPGIFHTQGGLRVDDDARVLTVSGDPIPNLFAVGGCTAGVSGRVGPRGYASGNGLLSAMGLGRLAGLAAAGEVTSAA
jgi:fumarate reductase flavoprotein subunit